MSMDDAGHIMTDSAALQGGTATFSAMGTMVSIDYRDRHPTTQEVAGVAGVFGRWDARFSLYRPESELSQVAAGVLSLPDAGEQLRSVYARAIDWRTATSGAFTPHRPDGVIDLDGIVKALAMGEAGTLLDDHGVEAWCLNVGGDVLVRGTAWTMGVVDPENRGRLLCSFDIRDPRRALATSGTGERGEHVWRSTVPSADEFVQVSVLADDIVTADVLATAILAGGAEFRDSATQRWPIDVITVTKSGSIAMTPGARAALAD
jgi:thiamine biosynthesis lipoprotein